ncbi:hypothetical protein [Chryseobacterium gilvum]|uniref:hypothetical protein n=1 Tax=Chryseobacterium gilvum TaxID=2976534 RepID=UPI0021D5E67F|nr:hypothetical protein [Chryseobacterium gilvum]
MEPQKKNTPNIWIIILFSLIPLMVIIYFILVTFFPGIFSGMTTGDIQTVSPNK